MKRSMIACIAAFGLTPLSASAAQAPSTEVLAARVRSLADAYIREVSQRFPEQVVFNGVPLERQDGLSDFSPAALREWHKLEDGWARQLERIDSAQLFGTPDYLAKARESIAIKANTGGEQCYQASFRGYTTLERPAAETFELGKREVERNLATALEVGRKYLQAEDLATLRERLSKDPANHFASREELLQFSRAAVTRAREHMPQWFARVPKSDIVVEPYPAVTERSASDSYWPAAQDGSYPAKFQITLYSFADVTRSNAEITALHEAYTGALEFFALRKLAQERLAERFDIREFHTALLENGTVTLPMLREQVLQWLQTKAQ